MYRHGEEVLLIKQKASIEDNLWRLPGQIQSVDKDLALLEVSGQTYQELGALEDYFINADFTFK